MKTKLNIGDRIIVQANEVLGTPEVEGTVVLIRDYGYAVHCDDDNDPEDYCEVNHDGNVVFGF